MAAAGRNDPPSTPHEALRSTPMRRMDGRQPSKLAGIIFGAVEGVYGPQNTPMLWQFIIAGTKERFEGHTHPQPPPQKYIRYLRGLLPIHSWHWRGAEGILWGARGPFLPAAALAVAVVMPVVFYAKATEKCNKNPKISCLLEIILFIIIL
jgi:hypothetical protein